jgi:hypothetical protein
MQAFLLLLKKAVGMVGLYFLKKYAAELAYDALVETLEKLAAKTETNTDNVMVANLKRDREEAIAIIKGVF